MGKRLFIAVDIDPAAREEIRRITEALRPRVDALSRATWVRPERMHLTLHFFGTADDVLERRMRDAMGRPVPEEPFDVVFDGLGFFPARGSPRVLWLGVREGMAPLRRIQTTLGEELQVRADHEGPFTPHLTLARIKDRIPRAKLAKTIAIPALAGPSRIDRVTLYESRLSPAGPTYLPLAEALLQP